MFTLRQAYQDPTKKLLEKFISNSEGFVATYHEEPNWKGIWTVYETPNGPQKLEKEVNGRIESPMVDILIFETMEEAHNLYSPYGPTGSVTNDVGFYKGLENIGKMYASLKKYKSSGLWRVRLSMKNDKPHWDFV